MDDLFSRSILPWLGSTVKPPVYESRLKQGIYIYGAGELGALALEYCEACNIPVIRFVDSNRSGTIQSQSGKFYFVYRVDQNQSNFVKDKVITVAIATSPYTLIHNQLLAFGWKLILPFYNITARAREGHPLQNGWFLEKVTIEEKNTVRDVYKQMIAYAKDSGRVECIDTTTNGSLMTPERLSPVLEAGLLDKINISVDSMNREQYKKFTGFDFDFNQFVENIKWLDVNKGACEVVIKIPGDLINEPQSQEFLDTFGDYCGRIFIENFARCWPEFDVEAHTGIAITKGIYQQPITPTDTCPYLFYSISVNADGLVSSCFLNWGRKLIVGDVRKESLKDIWHSESMNALRRFHLDGRRTESSVCGACGQLSHCLPDNIDAFRAKIIPNFEAYAHGDLCPIPGMTVRPTIPLVPA